MNNHIVFSNKKAATLFAKQFLKVQTEFWGGFEAVARYRIFADVLREALKDSTLTMADFWQDDTFVLAKLAQSTNKNIHSKLELLKNNSLSHLHKSNVVVHKKFRHVDPQFVTFAGLARVRQTNPTFAQELEQARAHNQLGIVMPKLPLLETR